jgi:competence protein ComEC
MASLKISVLNVGHGDFIYAATPLGNKLVIDCGNDGGDVSPARFLSSISTIDELQISHPHTDHFGDIIALSRKNIRSFRCPSLEKFTDKVIGWRSQDAVKIAKLRSLKGSINADNAAVQCDANFEHLVYFPGDINYEDANTSSIITVLRYGSFKMLFGGDLPDSGWRNLLENGKFCSAIKGTNVLKVPHHGRYEGCSEELFKYISPQLCIVSDKPIDDTNKNTVATDFYTKHSSGANIVGIDGKRKVLSTRNDGSIFIKVEDNGEWYVHRNTSWIKN